MEKFTTYVGLDVHKETISVAVAEGGDRGQARYFGKIANSAEAVSKLVKKLSGKGRRLRFCDEAGPCGYGIHRHLTGLGHDCAVVAPSLIPRRPGDRVKTDRRDCLGLAKLDRAGELTAVWVPDAAHEAMRDLVRARATAVRALRRARQQLTGFSAPPRPRAQRRELDPGAPPLAGDLAVRAAGPADRPGELHPGGRGRPGPT